MPQATCVFSQTHRFEDWASAATRFGVLLSSPTPRSIARWHSTAFVSALRRLRETGRFDAVVASRPALADMAGEAGFPRILVDLPDLESAMMRRALSSMPGYKSKFIDWAEMAKLRAYDAKLTSRFWRVSACKDEERHFFGGVGADKVFLIPNGTESFPRSSPYDEVPGELLFVGSLFYSPNIDAVTFFHRKIFPIIRDSVPHARFRIVGMNPHDDVARMDNGGDCIVNASVEDLEPYYAAAQVVVVPMRLGAGSKLKVVEALARGKALVSTTFGAEGFDLRPGVDLEIGDTAEEFAAHCSRLLHDDAERERLSANGRARVIEHYSWKSIQEAMLDALRANAPAPIDSKALLSTRTRTVPFQTDNRDSSPHAR